MEDNSIKNCSPILLPVLKIANYCINIGLFINFQTSLIKKIIMNNYDFDPIINIIPKDLIYGIFWEEIKA